MGWTDDPHWDAAAFDAVFDHTGGIPRRINRLCSRLLVYGVLEETHEITAAMVEATAEELQHDLEGGGASAADLPMPPSPSWPQSSRHSCRLHRRVTVNSDVHE